MLSFSPWRQCPALGEAERVLPAQHKGAGHQGRSWHRTWSLVEHLLQALLTGPPPGGAPACTGAIHALALHTCSPAHSLSCCPQMQQMYDMIMQHKRAMQDMQLLWEKALQQHQHGYDSDEEVDSELGTWEHQLRRMEMDKTRGALRRQA